MSQPHKDSLVGRKVEFHKPNLTEKLLEAHDEHDPAHRLRRHCLMKPIERD
ncbi:MAG: hypothetical protein ABIH11_04645 [Candidatus Altiarchaeota archaeon]